MKIIFLLPNPISNKPIGGYKVVYEYANRLTNDGHDVIMVSPKTFIPTGSGFKLVLKKIIIAFNALRKYNFYNKNCSGRSWFPLSDKVKELSVWNLKEKNVPTADVYIATYYSTAHYLKDYKRKSKKHYFVQCFENFFISDNEFIETLRFDLNKIVICEWLKGFCTQENQQAVVVNNGFDFSYFSLKNPIQNRNKYSISMMYNPDPWKGFDDAFNAVKNAKKIIPEITVELFGAFEKPLNLPNWATYHYKPNKELHNAIYNNSSLFVIASKNEGWGLPVGESMICGNAVICTNIGGFAEMAIHNKTALTSDVGDIDGMTTNIVKLVQNDELRLTISKNAIDHINQFTWEKAYSEFKKHIL